MKNIFMVILIVLCGILAGKEPIEKLIYSDVPAMVFTDQETLLIRTDKIFDGTSFQVLDWKGTEVASGTVGDGQLKLPPLARNYYRVFFPEHNSKRNHSFAVVVDPKMRKSNRHYSMVTSPGGAFSFFPDWQKAMAFFNRLYLLAGLEVARDYVSWSGVERKRGEYDFQQLDQKLTACKDGIRYSNLLERAPTWTSANKDGFPTDLLSVYNFGKAVAAHCGNNIAAWEFYNEIETRYNAWEYAAALKAFYLGVKAGNPNSQVALTSYIYSIDNGHPSLVLENGVENYFDIFNYHIYDDLRSYPQTVAKLKQILLKNNIPDKPIWITENNTRADGNAKIDIGIKNVKEQSFEQELVIAEMIPKSHLILQQSGITRNFTFILRPCNEDGGNRAWGLLRQDLSAKPGFVAFAVLSDQLGSAEYLEEINMPQGVRGFTFRQPDNSLTLVIWSKSELDGHGDPVKSLEKKKFFVHQVKLPSKQPLRAVETFGKEKMLHPKNGTVMVDVSRFPTYIHGIDKLTATQKRQTEFTPQENPRLKPSPVVISVEMTEKLNTVNNITLLIPAEKNLLTAELRLWNLSDTKQTGSIQDANRILTGIPETITLEPWERKNIPVDISTTAGQVKLQGIFNEIRIGDFVMPCIKMNSKNHIPVSGTEKHENWRDNVVRGGKTQILPQPNIVRFEVTFPPNADNWVYPYFTPQDQETQELIANAAGIYFEIRVEQKKKSKYNCVWLNVKNKTTGKTRKVRRNYSNISCGDWVENFVVCALAPDEAVAGFGIGLGPIETTAINYELRNIRVLQIK